MAQVLLLLGFLFFGFFGVVGMMEATTVIHQSAAGAFFCAASVSFGSSAIIDKLNALLKQKQ